MKRMVLLRHDLPSGEHHFDWLIDPGAGRELIAFRLASRPDTGELSGFEAERIEDHRRRYLDYEGPISCGRGHVTRVLSGSVVLLAEQQDCLGLVGDLGSWSGAIVGSRIPGRSWRFEMLG